MMGTLRNSSSKLLSDKYRHRQSEFSTHTPCRPQFRSLLLPFKHVKYVSFSPSISLPHKTTHLISPLYSLSSPDKQTYIKKEGQAIEDVDQSKTVRVKFQLERECLFGQQFIIVGDDPMLGLWNPSNALQLNWSDGHVWTVELGLPIGKSIKFKFLLKGETEEDILWQPGPDRILQTWETDNTICVCEDWDNADLRKIEEEESSSNTIDTSMAILAESSTQPIGSQTNNLEEEEEEEEPFEIGLNGRAMNVTDLMSKKEEGKIGSYEALPVLVPGLTPLPIAHTDEEDSTDEVEKNFTTDGAGEAKALDPPETQVVDTDSKETIETVLGDKQEPSQDEEAEKQQLAEEQDQTNTVPANNGVLENDIQWGRQTLQKLLSNFGIL